jgi:hypothetical protein
MLKNLLVVSALAASALGVVTPAHADHGFCGSGHGFQANAGLTEASTGTVDSFDTDDFWYDTSPITGQEGLRLVVLQPVSGDSDLVVWSEDCSTVICSSAAGGTTADTCLVDVSGNTYVQVTHFSGSSQYAISVTYSPLFIN